MNWIIIPFRIFSNKQFQIFSAPELPSAADLLRENGATFTPTKAQLLLTNKNSVRHQAVVNERHLELKESESENLLNSRKDCESNSNLDSNSGVFVNASQQSPPTYEKYKCEKNELLKCWN